MIKIVVPILIIFIIILLYNIIFKKIDKCFYTLEETFPALESFVKNDSFELILKDTNNVDIWKDWPEYNLWDFYNNPKSKWTVFPFKAFGKWHDRNIKLCPNIYRLLEKLGGNLINASLSKLGSNTKLIPHKGWGYLSNNVLRCHLGIIIPNDAFIYCKDDKDLEYQIRQQKAQQWIIFDDSKTHFADNKDLTNDRIVLILDLKRPSNIKKGNSCIKDTSELNEFLRSFNS